MEENTGYAIDPKNLFFDVMLGKTEAAPHYKMVLLERVAEKLPKSIVPIRFDVNNGGSFNATYYGAHKKPMIDKLGWQEFVTGNELVDGDAIVFEVIENTAERLIMKVQYMRLVDATSMLLGVTSTTAIDLD